MCSAPRTSIPKAIYIFVPGGAQPGALGKALAERGIDARKTKVMGQLEVTDDNALKTMGDAALGIITAGHYDSGPQVGQERRLREGLQRRLRPQPRLLLDRRLGRHAAHL